MSIRAMIAALAIGAATFIPATVRAQTGDQRPADTALPGAAATPQPRQAISPSAQQRTQQGTLRSMTSQQEPATAGEAAKAIDPPQRGANNLK
jgi:hypothetical protein